MSFTEHDENQGLYVERPEKMWGLMYGIHEYLCGCTQNTIKIRVVYVEREENRECTWRTRENGGFTEHTENGGSWNTRNTKMYNRNIWNIGGGVQGTRRKSGAKWNSRKTSLCSWNTLENTKVRGTCGIRGCKGNSRKSRGFHRTHGKMVKVSRSHTQNRGGCEMCGKTTGGHGM